MKFPDFPVNKSKNMYQITTNSIPMDKYRLVGERSTKAEIAQSEECEPDDICEVRITQQGKPRNYISYAMNLFVSELIAKCYAS